MSYEEMFAGALHIRHSAEQIALRVLVEVDDHVPAEYDVERPSKGPGAHQIELPEGNQRLELGRCAEDAAVPPGEPPLALRGRHALEALRGIIPGARMRQDPRVEIGGEDANIPAAKARH